MFVAGYQPVFEFLPGYPRWKYVSAEELAMIFTPGHGPVEELPDPIQEFSISHDEPVTEGLDTELWTDDAPVQIAQPSVRELNCIQYVTGDLNVLEAHCELLGGDLNPSLAATLQLQQESVRLAKQRRLDRKRKLDDMRQRRTQARQFMEIRTLTSPCRWGITQQHIEQGLSDDDIPLTAMFTERYRDIKLVSNQGTPRSTTIDDIGR